MVEALSGLGRFPDELLLDIFACLTPVREFSNDDYFQAAVRNEDENEIRQSTLVALCLSSSKFRNCAEPSLYSGLFHRFWQPNLRRQALFLRTLLERPELRKHITFAEYSISEYLDYTLEWKEILAPCHDIVLSLLSQPFADAAWYYVDEYDPSLDTSFGLFTLTLSLTPSVKDLVIENDSIPNFIHNKFECPHHSPTRSAASTSATKGLFKLRNLRLQYYTNQNDRLPGHDAVRTKPILDPSLFPSLRYLHLANAMAASLDELTQHIGLLRTLELVNIDRPIRWVRNILENCTSLRHFACKWDYDFSDSYDLSDLRVGLLNHKHSLQTLAIDTQKFFFLDPSPKLGSLADLTSLRLVRLNTTTLMAVRPFREHEVPVDMDQVTADHYMNTLLPTSIEELIILDAYGLARKSLALKVLAVYCPQLPSLKSVRTLGTRDEEYTLVPDHDSGFYRVDRSVGSQRPEIFIRRLWQ